MIWHMIWLGYIRLDSWNSDWSVMNLTLYPGFTCIIAGLVFLRLLICFAKGKPGLPQVLAACWLGQGPHHLCSWRRSFLDLRRSLWWISHRCLNIFARFAHFAGGDGRRSRCCSYGGRSWSGWSWSGCGLRLRFHAFAATGFITVTPHVILVGFASSHLSPCRAKSVNINAWASKNLGALQQQSKQSKALRHRWEDPPLQCKSRAKMLLKFFIPLQKLLSDLSGAHIQAESMKPNKIQTETFWNIDTFRPSASWLRCINRTFLLPSCFLFFFQSNLKRPLQ